MTTPRCEYSVHWWAEDLDETCTRPLGHRGSHTDGLWWWDSEGHRVPQDKEDES